MKYREPWHKNVVFPAGWAEAGRAASVGSALAGRQQQQVRGRLLPASTTLLRGAAAVPADLEVFSDGGENRSVGISE